MIKAKSLVLFATIVASVIVQAFAAAPTHALSGSEFRASRIIDNEVFYDKDAMTASQIQEFLNAKVPACDNWGTQPYAGTTRRAYSEARGEVFPLTCLKDYYENTDTKENNLQGRPVPAGAKSAAQIIYDAAQEYSINPQVLIVLLQKEQRLVTDDWPWFIQFRSAAGQGCPDTAPCDSQYYGFYNQVSGAAWQFRRYATFPNSYNHMPGQVNSVRYSPNASCGSSPVFIENQATASLYNYTPYQPNQAALNNLYGTGDDCSAYGNRNFWRYFNDWFGSTTLPSSLTDTAAAQTRIKTLVFKGQIYIFYYDSFQSVLRIATQNKTTGVWEFNILDGKSGGGKVNGVVGTSVAAAIFDNELHVFYYDRSNGNLRYARLNDNGGTWSYSNLDGDPGSTGGLNGDIGINPSAVADGSSLNVFYYDKSNGNLRHAINNGSSWKFRNLDGDPGSTGGLNGDIGAMSDATPYGGGLQLFYYNQTTGNLRHAWTSSSHGWKFEDLDGASNAVSRQDGNMGYGPVVTNYGTSSLQLFYYNQTTGNLRHAWTSSSHGWKFEDLDGASNAVSKVDADVGLNPSVQVRNDLLQVFYYDRTNGNLRNAWADANNGWRFRNLDGDPGSLAGRNGNIGRNSSVALFGSSTQLYYYDHTHSRLRHAWTDSTGWNFEDLGPAVIY